MDEDLLNLHEAGCTAWEIHKIMRLNDSVIKVRLRHHGKEPHLYKDSPAGRGKRTAALPLRAGAGAPGATVAAVRGLKRPVAAE